MNRTRAGRSAVLAGTLVGAVLVGGSEALVREAVNEERALGEVATRLGEIQERQEESNVFSSNEIANTGQQDASVRAVRAEQYRTILEGLSQASGNGDQAGYAEAYGAYREALAILEKTFQAEGLRRALAASQALARQEELRQETEALAEALAEQEKLSDEDLERLAEMAERQEALSRDIEENLRQPMRDAAEALQDMNLPEAAQQQDRAIEELRRMVDEEMGNEQLANAEEMENLRRMEESLAAMEQELRNAIEQQQPLTDQQRQEMAMQMDEAARELAENQMPEAAEATEQAMEQLMEPNDQAARQELAKALEQVRQQQQQLAQRQPQPPPVDPPMQEGEEQERLAEAVQEGQRQAADAGNEWQAGLPESERAALLSARQARHDDRMDEAVKRYFVELAK
jgi:hypothetical protein